MKGLAFTSVVLFLFWSAVARACGAGLAWALAIGVGLMLVGDLVVWVVISGAGGRR